MVSLSNRTSMALFSDPMDHYSHRVRIVMEEKGVTSEIIDSDANDLSSEILEVSPYAELPVLVDRDAFIDSMSDFYRFNNVSEHKPFKVDMEPVLKEIPIKLTPFSEWISQQDWNEELDTTAG